MVLRDYIIAGAFVLGAVLGSSGVRVNEGSSMLGEIFTPNIPHYQFEPRCWQEDGRVCDEENQSDYFFERLVSDTRGLP